MRQTFKALHDVVKVQVPKDRPHAGEAGGKSISNNAVLPDHTEAAENLFLRAGDSEGRVSTPGATATAREAAVERKRRQQARMNALKGGGGGRGGRGRGGLSGNE